MRKRVRKKVAQSSRLSLKLILFFIGRAHAAINTDFYCFNFYGVAALARAPFYGQLLLAEKRLQKQCKRIISLPSRRCSLVLEQALIIFIQWQSQGFSLAE
jgi:hypothetical protein